MGDIGARIRPLRESLDLGRAEFSEALGVKRQTIISIERGKQRPTEEVISGIGKQWPQFVYWLVTGNTREEIGDISPEIEQIRRSLDKVDQAAG
jgi:transcriptional regulator with XRE-family HTH domain